MHSRLRLDIGWVDLAAGVGGVVRPGSADELGRSVEARLFPAGGGIACLSVRSALDLYLSAIGLPRGSEVLVSALTIPDMVRVLEHHGLVAVPVDVDLETMAPRAEDVERAAGPRTRALLVAHLFGGRVDLDPLAELARERGWLVWEDAAQAFVGAEFRGHPGADLTLFSFGPIKTATALAGGVARVRDGRVLERMRALAAEQPLQRRTAYLARLLKYSVLVALTAPPVYGLFARLCELRGRDLDAVVRGSVRGFAGDGFFERIRHRPSAPLLRLLDRRLARFDRARVTRRRLDAEAVARELPGELAVPGRRALDPTWWVLPVLAPRPAALVAALREAGFDATHRATLDAVPPPPDRPELAPRNARRLVEEVVYVPAYPALGARGRRRLIEALDAFAGHPPRSAEPAQAAGRIG